jgi:hypothetical protein
MIDQLKLKGFTGFDDSEREPEIGSRRGWIAARTAVLRGAWSYGQWKRHATSIKRFKHA